MVSLAYEAAQHPEVLKGLSDEEVLKLEYDWRFWARPNQLEPDEFRNGLTQIWLILAGRGWGKTKTGGETVNERVRTGRAGRIALVAPTAADARDVMIEGPAGIVTTSPPWFRARYMPSKRKVIWPNGAEALLFSAEDPDQLRGPQHDLAWCDELAAWPRLVQQEVWDNLMFGLRIGAAQCIITTTPRPIPLLRDLIKRGTVSITKASTYENLVNLSKSYRATVVDQYEGTRLGRQELHAEILDDTPGALWTFTTLDNNRIKPKDLPPLKRIGVAIDPMGAAAFEAARLRRAGDSQKEQAHEVGILVGGVGYDDQGYLLADYSGIWTPREWTDKAIDAYDMHMADVIVAETNYGGEMVEQVIRDAQMLRHPGSMQLNFKSVKASRGKAIRAEPVAALDERGLLHLVGSFDRLEMQLTSWVPEDGPNDRLDAYVWLWTYLMSGKRRGKVWFI